MKMITRRGIFLWILCALFIAGIVFMTVSLVKNGDEWVMKRMNHHVYTNGVLVGAGTIYDRDGVELAKTEDGKRVYSDSKTTRKSTLHTVGDPKNFISTGVQCIYDSWLTGYSVFDGVYHIERYGKGNDLTLTIDSEICNVAYKALDGRKGTVGVVNYKTGEVICAVSSPSYDVNDVPDDLDTNEKYEGVYLNRLISAHYVPGSTFKIVTAICAIDNIPDIYNRKWDCDGGYQPDKGVEIKCNADHGHKVDFNTALAKSCNSVFAQIAIELGEKKLAETAKKLGIGSSVVMNGTIKSYGGNFALTKNGNASDDILGWTGIGQGETRIAPITMLRIVSAIANGGDAVPFRVVNSFGNQLSDKMSALNNGNVNMMTPETAEKVGTMLRNNVKNQYGDYNYRGLSLCAKSGTAQIDEYDDHNIAWFTGYMDDEEHPYAFVVTIENGNSGSRNAGPVANKVLQAVVDKY